MASKAGIAVTIVGAVAAPVTGYFIYSNLTSSSPAAKAPSLSVLSLNRNDGRAFDIENGCIKEKFSLGEIKSNIGDAKEVKQDKDRPTLGNHTGESVDGCLVTDVRSSNNTTKQHAIVGNIEMTLTKGNHGLIFRTLITNLLGDDKDAAFQHINQAYKLTKKTDGKWKLDDGYLWTDKAFEYLATASTQETSKLVFDGLVKTHINYWDLCSAGRVVAGTGDQKCTGLDSDAFKPNPQKRKWTSSAQSGKTIFEDLVIKGGKEGSEKPGDLWGNKSEDLFKNKLGNYGLSPHLYEEAKGFFKIEQQYEEKSLSNLTKWFDPFKDEKGSWT